MHFHQPFDQSQSDAKTRAGRLACIFGLHEHIENMRQRGFRYTDARIAHLDQRHIPIAFCRQPNTSAGRRVFRGVLQEVGQDLLQANRIAADPNRFVGRLDGKLMAPFGEERADRLGGSPRDGGQVRRPFLQDRRLRLRTPG